MGQKVHPVGFRLGGIKTSQSCWIAKKDYASLIAEDVQIRKYIKKNLEHAGVAAIEIRRSLGKAVINLHTARPGVIIGRKGAEIDKLRESLEKMTNKQIVVNIVEVENPAINAQLVAEGVAVQLVKRVPFRRVMKKVISFAMQSGAQGMKIVCAGRLGGAEIARTESAKDGKIPLHTLRADIDYGFAEAHTTYGLIGVKVWVCKGEII
ncbi:30S ribosomal protein S3 [bacterium]|nr:30S ribosomal protein S3 [bacterium]